MPLVKVVQDVYIKFHSLPSMMCADSSKENDPLGAAITFTVAIVGKLWIS